MTEGRAWRGRVFCGVSLDGYLARADSDLDWLTDPPSDVPHAEVTSSRKALEWDTYFPGIDHLVMGRGTYEKVLSFGEWPYAGKTVIVLGSTLTTDDERVTVARSMDEALALLESNGARSVYVDGGKTIQAFLAADLIDEITVAVAPVLIGGGVPLFGSVPADVRLRLEGTHATQGGMVHITYAVHRPAS